MNVPHKFWHRRRYLPHFDCDAIVQTITFRLADSLPRHVYESLLASTASKSERAQRLEAMIDEGRGACLLSEPGNAAIVQDTLNFFDGTRYRLIAWVVMPNHVHSVIEQVEGHRLGDIVRSWKTFSANRINKLRGGAGSVWAKDYYDRYIRDGNHFEEAVNYVEHNPVRAGLVLSPQDWPYSSAWTRKV